MRILISAVGTRGDVQPAMALALEVRALGQQVRLCVPPNFVDEAVHRGFDARPIGVEMRAPRPGAPPPVVPDLIADQFQVLRGAIEDCDLVVGAGAHQYAARSVAEAAGVPWVVAAYAPTSLPSAELGPGGQEGADNQQLWTAERGRWNARSGARLNANRAALGLAPVDDVIGHILGEQPWLAADPTLGPAPSDVAGEVVQTGAWIRADDTPLPAPLSAFLDAGDPPIYLGFGSMPAAGEMSRTLIAAARAVGRRAILSRGWAGLELVDEGGDCIAVGDVNHRALFPRLAAVVHHGGAGTTTAAALAGVPQVLAPMFADQFYWAARLGALGAGTSAPAAGLTVEELAARLEAALRPEVAERARSLAGAVGSDGAARAARRLADSFG